MKQLRGLYAQTFFTFRAALVSNEKGGERQHCNCTQFVGINLVANTVFLPTKNICHAYLYSPVRSR